MSQMPMSMPMPMPDDNMMMHMTFFWGKDVVMLFNDWPNGKLAMYILALAFVFVLAVSIEIFSVFPAINTSTISPIVADFAQASVYGLRMALAYIVMLAVMSYNLGIFMVAVLGHVVGFSLVKYRTALKAKDGPV